MDKRTVQTKAGEIRQDIRRERGALQDDLSDLQAKVRHTTDWREQFRRNTVTMLGAAFASGMLLPVAFGGGR